MPTEKALSPRRLADFEGRWRIRRQIVPEKGAEASFEGHGIWSPEGSGLAYAEQGLLRLPDAPPMQAERRYFWQPDLCIFFDDGRFFHQVPAMGGRADHWCDPDHYAVDYDFSRWPDFVVTWAVRGPRKAYRMQSRFTPDARP